MNIKDLNEQFGKFLMNEISDETVGSLKDKRFKNLAKAGNAFAQGKGSLASLQKAKEKNANAQDLIAKRDARKKANYKHTLKFADVDRLFGLSDDDLIRVANAMEGNAVTTIKEAKEKISKGMDMDGDVAGFVGINYRGDGEEPILVFGSNDYDDYLNNSNDRDEDDEDDNVDVLEYHRYFTIYFDMTPDEVKAGKDKEKAKEEKKRKKVFKALEPANLAKEVKKSGKVCDVTVEDADNVVEYWFSYELKNNTGLSSQEELNKYLYELVEADDIYDYDNLEDYFSELLDDLNAVNVVPEVKDMNGELYIYTENKGNIWIELIDKNTLAIHDIIAVLEV